MVDYQVAKKEGYEMDKIGFAKIDITPDFPVDLYNHCKRYKNINDVLDPIYAKCLTLDGLSIISVDLLYVPNSLYSWAKDQTSRDLILNASHAHATPDMKNEEYISFLKRKLRSLLFMATEQSLGQVYYGESECYLNINRRMKIHRFNNIRKWKFKKTIEVRPNPAGPVDRTVRVIKIVRPSLDTIYVINYSCHATMWHGASISADWPGRIKVDGEVMFLQGFSGNLIPNNIKTDTTWKDKIVEFVEGTPDFKKHGCTELDMVRAANDVSRSINNVEYKRI